MWILIFFCISHLLSPFLVKCTYTYERGTENFKRGSWAEYMVHQSGTFGVSGAKILFYMRGRRLVILVLLLCILFFTFLSLILQSTHLIHYNIWNFNHYHQENTVAYDVDKDSAVSNVMSNTRRLRVWKWDCFDLLYILFSSFFALIGVNLNVIVMEKHWDQDNSMMRLCNFGHYSSLF